jgi:glycosyltransferase involved in cell wall biosynthesis
VILGIERLLRSRTARFVTVSRANADKGARLRLLDPRRTIVVRNGIEYPQPVAEPGRLRAEIGVDVRKPLVLSIGRFDEPKDQVTLLRAWDHARRTRPDAVLTLIGSGEMEATLREVASSARLGDSVRFLRPRADLAPAYTDADIFALSSRWEGLPYVVLEAMAYGLPVVSTGVDGIPEAVIDGETGLLVPARDPRALGDALALLLAAPHERERMGIAGRARVLAEFSLDRMVEQLLGVYREVTRTRGV